MAKWVLPVPVPPTRTALRRWARKPPPARSRIANERLVDRGAGELEVVEILGERQLGNSELVTDRTCLLLIDLGGQQVANDALGFVLALDGGGHDLVEGGLHAIEFELAHKVEQLSAFHQTVLLRLS
jgi:hypothetical protein